MKSTIFMELTLNIAQTMNMYWNKILIGNNNILKF